jgi:putative hydrolase of the HAD superfamily
VQARTVLVDYGEVLSESQPPETLDAMAQLTAMAVPTFVERYWQYRPSYDRGGSARAFWSSMISAEMEDQATLDELVRLDITSWSDINEHTLEVLEDVRRREVSLSLLSNAPRELASALRRDSIFELFDHLIFSSELGLVKPEPGIFEAAIEIVSAPPSEILFVDDRAANVEAAVDAGMQAILFSSAAQLQAELGRWLAQVP